MTAPLKTVASTNDLSALMQALGQRSKHAARVLALAPTRQKDDALAATANAMKLIGEGLQPVTRQNAVGSGQD